MRCQSLQSLNYTVPIFFCLLQLLLYSNPFSRLVQILPDVKKTFYFLIVLLALKMVSLECSLNIGVTLRLVFVGLEYFLTDDTPFSPQNLWLSEKSSQNGMSYAPRANDLQNYREWKERDDRVY